RILKSDFDRKVVLDLSSAEKEYQHGLIPLSILFDTLGYNAWKRGFNRLFRSDDARLDLLDNFDAQVWQRFFQYRLPVIERVTETRRVAVCQIFEKVNTGGEPLTVFELATATFASDDFRLREDWEKHKKRLSKHKPLADFEGSDFLTAVTLLTNYNRFLARKG